MINDRLQNLHKFRYFSCEKIAFEDVKVAILKLRIRIRNPATNVELDEDQN